MFLKNVFIAQIRIQVEGILNTSYDIPAKVTVCWPSMSALHFRISESRGHLHRGMILINIFIS